MYRSHHCGALTAAHIGTEVQLAGWIAKTRDKGFMLWIDLRDRYGITQLVLDEQRSDSKLLETAKRIGRETVIQVSGTVLEREAKNPNIPTGDIEVLVTSIDVLSPAQTPPFTIEDNTDGKITALGVYKDGKKEGDWLLWVNGELLRVTYNNNQPSFSENLDVLTSRRNKVLSSASN